MLMPGPGPGPVIDFAAPFQERALLLPDSVSWRIFKNPLAVLIGGIAAVILELAEPSVRTGVWQYTSFRKNPKARLQRTGLAAMVTVYGARSVAEPLIARVARIHATVTGVTPGGLPFSAADPELLAWVHATAVFGFAQAYDGYASKLSGAEIDAYYSESVPAARLYGAVAVPQSRSEMQALFESMRERLQPSPIVFEFLHILGATPLVPAPLGWLQGMLIRAAIEVLPSWARVRLGLDDSYGFRPLERRAVAFVGALADRVVLPASPAAQSCVRLGLPLTYLYG